MFLFAGDSEKCKALIGLAVQERHIVDSYAKQSGLGIFGREVELDNGAVLKTIFNGTATLSLISVPPVSSKLLSKVKAVENIVHTVYKVDLVSNDKAYSGLYVAIPDEIFRVGDLYQEEKWYTEFDGYFTLDTTNLDRYEESCVCITNGIANTAADNVNVMSTDHKDDWHAKKFAWVGFPLNWAGVYHVNSYSATWAHPGLESRSSGTGFHWSHSPYTYGGDARFHYSRGIDLEKRIYRPGRVDLYTDDGSAYLMTTTLRKQYGKTPWTRDISGKVIRYNERVESSGVGTWTQNQPGDNWIMYLWPFVPYLWELPYFFIFSWSGNDVVYGQCYIPETGVASKQWSYIYTNITGVEVSEVKSTDAASFNGTPVITTTYTSPRPHYEWSRGSPVLVDGPLSNTWNDTTNSSNNWSSSIEKTVPIGPVCNGNILSFTNKVVLSGSYTYTKTTDHTKSTDFGDGVYLFPPSYTEMWGLGTWTDTSSIGNNESTKYSIAGTVTSSLKYDSATIDSGSGVLSYSAERTTTMYYSGVYQWINDHMDPFGGGAVGHAVSTGTRQDNSVTTVSCNRSMIGFEVLDYDSETNFNLDNDTVAAFAVVYKRITVTNSLPRNISSSSNINSGSAQAGMLSAGGGFNSVPREPTSGEITSSDVSSRTGTRLVEYVLYVNVNGTVYTKTLATFTGGIGTGSGQRCYGVVVKVMTTQVVVTYDLENFVADQGAQNNTFGYDSPLNYEDWNTCNSSKIWSTYKRVIGIVNLSDSSNWAYNLFDECDPIPDEVYGINIRTLETKV